MKTNTLLLILLAPIAVLSQNKFVAQHKTGKAVANRTIGPADSKINQSQDFSYDIKLSLIASWTTDSTKISFMSGATNSFDTGLDILKLAPSNTVDPYISTICSSLDLDFNALPISQRSVTIPIRVKVGISGKYILNMDSNLLMLSNVCMMLEDLSTTTIQDFKANPSYSFVIADTTNAPRFLLHIGQGLTKTVFSPSCSYKQNGMGIVSSNSSGTWNCTWLDSLGNILISNTNIIGADTLKNLSPGVYPIIVNGNSGYCNSTFNDTIIINPTTALSVNVIITNVNCPNTNSGMINANVVNGGQAPFSYNWSNGGTSSFIQNLNTGVYILILTDANGCNDTTMYAVQQLSNLYVNFTISADTLTMINPTLTFSNQTTGQTNLAWDFGDGSPLSNTYNPTHTYSTGGIYTIELLANDLNCTDMKQKVIVVLNPTGITSETLSTVVNIYYASDGAVIKFNLPDPKDAVINVYSLEGKLINTKQTTAYQNTETISLGEASGIYLVEVRTNTDKLLKKVIK